MNIVGQSDAIRFASQLANSEFYTGEVTKMTDIQKGELLMTNSLYVQYSSQDLIDPTYGDIVLLTWLSPETYGVLDTQVIVVNIVPGTANPSATPFPTFPNKDAAFAYYQSTVCTQMISDVNTFFGVSFYTTYDAEKIDSSVAATVANKSSKANFSALSTLAAHGVANAITTGGISTTLPTNYNLVSGILGLANGLNDANTAQNALSADFIDHVGKFNALLSWLGTNKDAINALKTAGAA